MSKCPKAPTCAVVDGPKVDMMPQGQHQAQMTGDFPKDLKASVGDYKARISSDTANLNTILGKMQQIVTADDFKSLADNYTGQSVKLFKDMSKQSEMIDKAEKKLEKLEQQMEATGADLENSRLEITSHMYFYVLWTVLAIIMAGVAFRFLKQPIFRVIAGAIAFIVVGIYVFRQVMKLVEVAENEIDSISIDKMIGP